MKKLYLVRHAKSSWENDVLLDIDRPLNQRGYTDAQVMSKRLKGSVHHPFFISSTAIRAISTALIFSRAFEISPKDISLSDRLYETSAEEYLDIIRSANDKHHTLFIFGHNPTISATLDLLVGGTEEMSTCAVAGIEFNVQSWKNIDAAHAKLVLFDFPKNKN